LEPGQYLIHDRDGKYCPGFQHIVDAAGITRVPLPPRSPNLNAYAVRWVRSVTDELLSRLILVGESSLRYAIQQYETHYHQERPHQGKDNVVRMTLAAPYQGRAYPIQCRERLDGLLNDYDRQAA
jgi:putative transposase